ncbi:DpnD/PcfM family protein [Marivirga tractuosa]|uniref:DpnD/PcfM family protein n=1 Tax=Marivirga tractuosa TaxID=1006 RepID=UPI0035CFE6F1
MNTFEVQIKEFLSKVIEVEANSIEEAISKAREKYEKEEIVLGSEDFITTEIEEHKDERP